eukprot:3148567-Rhodomonas_salina.1
MPIGTAMLDIDAGGNMQHMFEHVFESRAHVCLEAKILSVGEGGNADMYNDRTQINWEVVHAGESAWVYVPFGNGADEEIVVEGTDIQCVRNETVVPCTGTYNYNDYEDEDEDNYSSGYQYQGSGSWFGSSFFRRSADRSRRNGVVSQQPTLTGVPSTLRANEEVIAELTVPEVAAEGMIVMVEATMNGEKNNVMIQIVKTSVPELLNTPMVCCIKSIKTRVMLETMLADALDSYESGSSGACKATIKILRMFIQKAILLLCDLSKEEKACIEKALVRVVDAARMTAIELGQNPDAVAKIKENPDAVAKIKEGDYFRRAGLYEAALMEYAKAC